MLVSKFDYVRAEFIIIKFFLLSTPLPAESGEPNCSQEEEIRPLKEEKGEDEEETNQEDEKEEKDLDSLEWELRNTDSVFSELSELSQEYVETVDHGVSVSIRGTAGIKQARLVQFFFFSIKKKCMLYKSCDGWVWFSLLCMVSKQAAQSSLRRFFRSMRN